jgi:hypothetical protein
VDELVYFAARMHAIFTNDNQSFLKLMGTLTPEKQKEVSELVEKAKVREVENTQKEQQRLQQKAQQK